MSGHGIFIANINLTSMTICRMKFSPGLVDFTRVLFTNYIYFHFYVQKGGIIIVV